ncbi:hypothetical protein KJK32_00160 [Streptomyces sp. JCM17656]|nr:hypothetical protein KJK32_00160 [Streptomyces sp. JCM17656]
MNSASLSFACKSVIKMILEHPRLPIERRASEVRSENVSAAFTATVWTSTAWKSMSVISGRLLSAASKPV